MSKEDIKVNEMNNYDMVNSNLKTVLINLTTAIFDMSDKLAKTDEVLDRITIARDIAKDNVLNHGAGMRYDNAVKAYKHAFDELNAALDNLVLSC